MSGDKGGRPVRWNDQAVGEEIKALIAYVDKTDYPIREEFCAERRYGTSYLYDWVSGKLGVLSDSVKKELVDAMGYGRAKSISYLKKAVTGDKFNMAMVIFTLKNVAGWRDDKYGINISANASASASSNLDKLSDKELRNGVKGYYNSFVGRN